MGTNYYAVRRKPTLYNREIHLGKSSAGWLFLFHDNEEFHTYPQFKRWLENNVDTGEYVLFNEYNEELTKEELLSIIDIKQADPHNINNPDNFRYGTKNIDGYRFNDGDFS
ncbi:MAG: hypothetical protein V8R01_01490 [Bacilli bacterium]